jgi:glycyl-tRNA synthetase
MDGQETMEKIISLCKRKGFIYPGSEIYGGLAGTYDYGPLGTLLRNNICNSWVDYFVKSRDDMYLVDTAILMNGKVWEATGHTSEFIDPLVECTNCNKRFRVDQIIDEEGYLKFVQEIVASGEELSSEERELGKKFLGPIAGRYLNKEIPCPQCDKKQWGIPRQFNLMLETRIGAALDSSSVSYLRPETAQGMFVNFKNIVDSFSPKLPFGIAQIGKAFRNEITPRDFIFRVRELEQMEIEYFIRPDAEWYPLFENFLREQKEWLTSVGVNPDRLHMHEHDEDSRAHYAKSSVDWNFEFPFGTKELTGLAHRTDFDLMRHAEHSKQNLHMVDQETGQKFLPHTLEPTIGVGRTLLAVLSSAYDEDIIGGETRTVLRFPKHIAPYRACVSPLLKNREELQAKAREVFALLKKQFGWIMYDDNGNIGKRYRRQDEIGTPYCITIDFDTLENNTVTVRDRDTGDQERVPIAELISKIS